MADAIYKLNKTGLQEHMQCTIIKDDVVLYELGCAIDSVPERLRLLKN